jgi:hypothetical protein
MARVAWGRRAVLTVDGTNLVHIKDLAVDDSAADQTAEARYISHVIHGKGAKSFSISFQLLLKKTDAAVTLALRASYDEDVEADADLVIIVKRYTGGPGYQATMQVFQWNESFSESEGAVVDVVLQCTDPDNLPIAVAAA